MIDIPSPPGWPIIGNLLQIPHAQLSQHLLKTSRQFEGIFQLNFLGRRLPFVYSAELVAELCDQTRFRKMVVPPLSFLRNITGNGLFTARSDDPKWEIAHRILKSAFSHKSIENYFPTMCDVAQSLVNKWQNQGPSADINVVDDMTRFTLETITRCGFGYSFHPFESETFHPFLQALSRTLDYSMTRIRHLPYSKLFQRDRRQAEKDVKLLLTVVNEIMAQREQHPTDGKDLLNLMLNERDPHTEKKLDQANIRYQIMTFLIAGHETTSGMLSFALYFLLQHPEVLSQAYAQVDQILPGNTVPTFEDIAKLDVLDRILKESLRLWPTAPAMVVAPFEDTVIGGKYFIKRNQWTSVILPALHRDPTVWTDPESFDINRFLPENKSKIPPFSYLPFGNGRRACLGAQFALTESKLILAMILQRFALSDPYHYHFKIKESLSLKPENLILRVHNRPSPNSSQ